MQPQRRATLPIPPFSDHINGVKARTWLVPCGIVPWSEAFAAAGGYRLAGGRFGFSHIDVIIDGGDLSVVRIKAQELLDAAAAGGPDAQNLAATMLERITRPRGAIAGLEMDSWHIMGIINTTPDSFSDGGAHLDAEPALAAARKMAEAGAGIIDIGGESTRPQAAPVSHAEEEARILPVITALADEGLCISADTRHTPVMACALDAGAVIINDVNGLRDEGAAELIASRSNTGVVIMHMQGDPATMQDDPQYRYAPLDIFNWLEERIASICAAGIPRDAIVADPGFGFGKTPQHNMQIMSCLGGYHGLGVPILLGASRKSSIAHYSRGEAASERQFGSIALATLALAQGVQIIRTHDVSETWQALAVAEAALLGPQLG